MGKNDPIDAQNTGPVLNGEEPQSSVQPQAPADSADSPFADPHIDPRSLPDRYGRTRLTLLVRDPEWIFAYWEISDADKSRHGIDIEDHGRKFVLRVYDVTDGSEGAPYHDVAVTNIASSWYLHLQAISRSWRVEFGLLDGQGRFVSIAESNTVVSPPDHVSDQDDREWMEVDEETFEKIFKSSGAERLARGDLEGSESAAPVQLRRIHPWHLAGASEQIHGASEAPTSQGAAAETNGGSLRLESDFVLHGSVEPGTELSVAGEPVRLQPDGSFSVRMALPEGEQTIEVKAGAGAGEQSRRITVKVERIED